MGIAPAVSAVSVVAAMAVIAPASVVAAMPVTMTPRIIAGRVIDRGSAAVIIGAGAVITVRAAVIAAPDSNPDADMHSGIGLAGEAQHSQQRNN